MAVSPVVIKAIVTAATDKRTWKVVGIIIAVILLPFILLIMMIAGMVSGVESANNELLDYSFVGTAMPNNFTDEQREVIENMRDWLGELDGIISEKENNEDCSLDGNMVRAAFYCLNFGAELDEDFDYGKFCDCFDGLTFEQLDTALQNVSEEFPQYEITDNISYSIRKVYEYLNGEAS
ncbi:MAG: hypothetical protein OSJ43_17335 [Oscillospiraceae bacterium]|nr:hypothetical protein [Oscillospiraceae bacterium]